MKIHCIYGIGYDSNIYLIIGENTTMIDTGTGLNINYTLDKIKSFINPSEIKQIVLTHEHFDHCGGIKPILEIIKKKILILAHEYASKKMESGKSNFAEMLGAEMPIINVDVKLSQDDEIILGDEKFIVLHTPGHTPGSICLYSKDKKIIFTGDTVFSYGSFGRYDLPGGNKYQLQDSIKRLSRLDVKKLYPGHEKIIEIDGYHHIKKSLENICYYI
jgi:glyoxylase-like metal-dependent hydrolase (beta-lactamase superfamily II)